MSDDRFKALSTDPRYRLPSRREARTAVDPRFKRLFKDQEFRQKATVDRYGRKLDPKSGKKDLQKRYRLEKDEQPKEKNRTKVEEREVVGSSEESESDEEEDEELATKRDPAREGGFSESSSEEDSSEEESDLDEEAELAEATAGQEQTEDIPMGEVTSRIGCVNLDWDNIRAADIMAVAASFAPADGKVESVVVYPSEFGRERMEREELEGPPREIFASSKRKSDVEDDDEEDSEDEDESEDGDEDRKIQKKLQKAQVSEGDEFDTAALRQYQLERLRYFYAVITCSSDACAKRIYDALDGHEYLNTANFFDLRFIPEEVSFEDDTPREECRKLPDGYRPNDFRTEALTHSKVRLTWDDDDPERKEVQKRAFSRAEIDENDMQAYIGSDSSDAESVASKKSSAEDRKAKKKEAERAKMRAALGLSEEPAKSKKKGDEPVGDMQITFTSGIMNGGDKGGVFENEPQDEESTRDRYIRKERERKQKRKERAKFSRKPEDVAADESEAEGEAEGGVDGGDDLGFDDPFFHDPEAAAKAEKKAKRADKERKKAAKDEVDDAAAAKRAELELLMAGEGEGDNGDGVRHFDMREIEKAEKDARRKGKKKKGKKGEAVGGEKEADGFEMDAEDPRFRALFESHEFAIDPTNARYKKTKGMERLREEGRRKRKVDDGEAGDGEAERRSKKSKKEKGKGGDEEVKGLVARLGGKKTKA